MSTTPESRSFSGTVDVAGPLDAWLGLAAGAAAWWLIGYLPWLLWGLHRTQLTGSPIAVDQGARDAHLAVPVLPEELTGLITMAVIGGVAAVAPTRFWPRPQRAAGWSAAGAALAAAAATLQAQRAATTIAGDFTSDPRVVRALATVVATTALAGILLGLVAAIGPVWMVPIALAAPAALLPGWLEQLLPGDQTGFTRWAFAISLGVVLGVCLSRPAQLVVWVPAIAIAWTSQAIPPALLAVGSTIRPGNGLENDPWLPATVGQEVFEVAFTTPEAHQWPSAWVAAAAIAVLLTGLRLLARGRAAGPDKERRVDVRPR